MRAALALGISTAHFAQKRREARGGSFKEATFVCLFLARRNQTNQQKRFILKSLYKIISKQFRHPWKLLAVTCVCWGWGAPRSSTSTGKICLLSNSIREEEKKKKQEQAVTTVNLCASCRLRKPADLKPSNFLFIPQKTRVWKDNEFRSFLRLVQNI